MTKRLVIAGAGGFGRGVLAWLNGSPKHLEREQIGEIVFIDDGAPAVPTDVAVAGTITEYEPQDRDEVLCTIAAPRVRRRIASALAAKGAIFHTFVDDRSVVAPNSEIGVGAIVCPSTVISANVRLGDHVHVNFNCSIGHDAVIEKFSTLSPAVNVMGGVNIGEDSLLGGSAVILPRVRVGCGVVLGAGTVVTSEVENDATVVGNPATRLPAAIEGAEE